MEPYKWHGSDEEDLEDNRSKVGGDNLEFIKEGTFSPIWTPVLSVQGAFSYDSG